MAARGVRHGGATVIDAAVGTEALTAGLRRRGAIDVLAAGVLTNPLPSAVATLDGRFVLANGSYCQMVGRSLEQLRELNVADVTYPEDAPRDLRALKAVARGQLREHQIRKRYVRPNGDTVPAWSYVSAVHDEDGLPVGLLANVVEVTEQPDVPERSLSDERSFRLLFAANPQPMWIFDLETLRFLEVNDAACAHYGFTRRQFLARTIADIGLPEEVPALRSHVASGAASLRHHGARRHRRADGEVIEVELATRELFFDGRDAVLVTITDVTERNLLERQLMHQALHHPLTGLPNRALFVDRLAHLLAGAGPGRLVGVLYVDLDAFHLVNESLGHAAGDAVLAELGTRLAARVPDDVTVATLAGEELAVCVGGLSHPTGAVVLARQVQRLIGEPITFGDGGPVSLSACVGVTVAAEPTRDPAELLRDAAEAAERAKTLGPGHMAVADDDPARAVQHGRLGARQRLRQAIETGEIVVHYQPVVSLVDRSVVGVEALARWVHPERGLLAPAEFIPLAEETGLIVPLGRQILERACTDASTSLPRRAPTGEPFVVSVNVSGHQLRGGELAPLVGRIVEDCGVDPARLALEMTETALVADDERTGAELAALREIGVHLSLDDFGTGYSSLTRLDRHPFDIVKIDRSFVTGMHEDSRHQRIVAGVISLATSLGCTVVAEGVETEEEVRHLTELGASLAQGYHFSAPMPLESLSALLGAEARRSASAPSSRTYDSPGVLVAVPRPISQGR